MRRRIALQTGAGLGGPALAYVARPLRYPCLIDLDVIAAAAYIGVLLVDHLLPRPCRVASEPLFPCNSSSPIPPPIVSPHLPYCARARKKKAQAGLHAPRYRSRLPDRRLENSPLLLASNLGTCSSQGCLAMRSPAWSRMRSKRRLTLCSRTTRSRRRSPIQMMSASGCRSSA